MPKYVIKLFSLFIMCSLVIYPLTPAFSTDIDNYYDQQKNLNSQINSTKSVLNQKEKQRKVTLNELYSLNRNIEKANDEISTIENKLKISEKNIATAKEEIVEKQAEVDERTAILEDRLREIYMQGDVNILEVLFQSTSISDFLTRFELLKRIAKNDSSLLSVLETERVALDDKKAKLEAQKRELTSLKSSQEKKKNQLQIASADRKELVKRIEKEKSAVEKALNDLENQSKWLESEIMRLQSKGGTKPGKLLWPTPGYYRISSPYGYRIHPITKTRRFHTGVDIPAPYGSKALAGANGKVIFTGWKGAYGNTIIVDHGGGMASMYPHLSGYLVKVGDQVTQGQAIGKIGTSGWSTGAHIHYEVRINGKHTNPIPYMQK